MNTIDPFRPAVSEPAIAELAARLDHVRWPDEAPPSWPYYARLHGRWPIEGRVEVPTGYAAFAREILRPPRQAAKRPSGSLRSAAGPRCRTAGTSRPASSPSCWPVRSARSSVICFDPSGGSSCST